MKVHIITLGFDNTVRIISTIGRFFVETDTEGLDLEFYVVDAKYPYPNVGANTLNLCQYLWQSTTISPFPVHPRLLVLPKNFGQTGNYNYLRDKFEYDDNDVIVFYDTDVRPAKSSWLKDKLRVLSSPETAFVTMNCSITDNALKHQGQEVSVNGVPCRAVNWPGGWPSGAWKGSFFRNGLIVTHEFYGGTEYNIMIAWRKMGMQGYMMTEHDDLRALEGLDPCYQEWKQSVIAVAGHQQSFEDFLKERKLIL